MKKLIVASANEGKIKEIRAMLPDYEVVPYKEVLGDVEIEENGATFAENALIKAKTVSQLTGQYALADDSGLCVDALGGAPGVFSARYTGKGEQANIDKILEEMQGVAARGAKFCCAAVLYRTDGAPVTSYGETYGTILDRRTGANGFGYDAIFYSNELNMPMGLASPEQKNSVSHRGKALRELKSKIELL